MDIYSRMMVLMVQAGAIPTRLRLLLVQLIPKVKSVGGQAHKLLPELPPRLWPVPGGGQQGLGQGPGG